jgi:hypothetical protein
MTTQTLGQRHRFAAGNLRWRATITLPEGQTLGKAALDVINVLVAEQLTVVHPPLPSCFYNDERPDGRSMAKASVNYGTYGIELAVQAVITGYKADLDEHLATHLADALSPLAGLPKQIGGLLDSQRKHEERKAERERRRSQFAGFPGFASAVVIEKDDLMTGLLGADDPTGFLGALFGGQIPEGYPGRVSSHTAYGSAPTPGH